jgi:hypothetical protein
VSLPQCLCLRLRLSHIVTVQSADSRNLLICQQHLALVLRDGCNQCSVNRVIHLTRLDSCCVELSCSPLSLSVSACGIRIRPTIIPLFTQLRRIQSFKPRSLPCLLPLNIYLQHFGFRGTVLKLGNSGNQISPPQTNRVDCLSFF